MNTNKPFDAAVREQGATVLRVCRAVLGALPLDLSLSAGFWRTVQQFLPHIGYGSTMSYGEVARGVGNPKAVRAVGTVCATNPLPVVVPCHRVVRTDGGMGNYAGGVEAKRLLLGLERSLPSPR